VVSGAGRRLIGGGRLTHLHELAGPQAGARQLDHRADLEILPREVLLGGHELDQLAALLELARGGSFHRRVLALRIEPTP
jgi:hypothetical protein